MIYRKSGFGHRVISGGHRERPGTTGGAPGVHRVGPPIPVGPLGRKGKCPALMGWRTTRGPPPHAPRVETLGGRGRPTCLGGQGTPLGRRPLADWICGGSRRPPWPLYICGGERAAAPKPWRLSPSRHTSILPTQGARRSPAAISTASVITPSCCRISDDFSSPLLDQEGGDVAAPDMC